MPPLDLEDDEKRVFTRTAKWRWAYCRYLWESHISVDIGVGGTPKPITDGH